MRGRGGAVAEVMKQEGLLLHIRVHERQRAKVGDGGRRIMGSRAMKQGGVDGCSRGCWNVGFS